MHRGCREGRGEDRRHGATTLLIGRDEGFDRCERGGGVRRRRRMEIAGRECRRNGLPGQSRRSRGGRARRRGISPIGTRIMATWLTSKASPSLRRLPPPEVAKNTRRLKGLRR